MAEVASIFVDGLLHVVDKPQHMITARTNPDPSPRENTTFDVIEKKIRNIDLDKINDILNTDLNPFN